MNKFFACRVCLATDYRNKIIMNNDNGLLDLFDYCFGVQINLQEQARTLCEECADKINKFSEFKKKCLESQTVWKSNMFLMAELKVEFVKNEDIVEIKDEDEDDPMESQNLDEPALDTDFKIKTDSLNLQETVYNYTHTLQYKQKLSNHKSNKGSQNSASGSGNNTILKSVMTDSAENKNNLGSYGPIIRTRRIEEPITCKCGMQYGLKRNYNLHIKKCKIQKFYESQTDVLQSCGLCKFSTLDVNILCKHLDDHFKINDLECKLCDYAGRDFAEMAYHRYTHQKPKTRMFCHKCHQPYPTPKTLMFHFRSVHLRKKGGLCFYCDDALASIKGWKKHELRKHSNNIDRKFYFCDCCGIKFVYRYEIVKHLRQRAGFYKVVCDECGAEFLRESNLRSHIRNKHTKHEMVKCPHCDKTMKDINLTKHIENVHGEKKYVCELCSENFRTLVNFKYHMLSHTKERPFKCDICGVDYKNKSTLYMHMMKHKGLRPHVCSVCSKAFSTRNQLKVHGSVHTKVKSVKCEHCDKSFHFKRRLFLHHTRMHPDISLESEKETAI